MLYFREILYYVNVALMAVVACLIFKLFWLHAIIIYLFWAWLVITYYYGCEHLSSLAMILAQIIAFNILQPEHYIFTFFMIIAAMVYWFAKSFDPLKTLFFSLVGFLVLIKLFAGAGLMILVGYHRLTSFFSDYLTGIIG